MLQNDSKNLLLSIFGIALLIIAVTGVTFAIFTYTSSSVTEQVVSTGSISMSYIESETNIIEIADAMPMSDEVGKIQNDYFDFKISSTINGKATIQYEIRAEQLPSENQLNSQNVKVYLEKEESSQYLEVLKPINFMIDSKTTLSENASNSMYLYSSSFSNLDSTKKSFTDRYRFRMWVDEKFPIETDSKSFKIKINVYART